MKKLLSQNILLLLGLQGLDLRVELTELLMDLAAVDLHRFDMMMEIRFHLCHIRLHLLHVLADMFEDTLQSADFLHVLA